MKACTVAFLVAALAPLPALAGPLSGSCLVGNRPAASLLFPYFEVDLAAGDGTTTLISIGRTSEETPEPLQSWIAPLIGARGRFSIGLEATRLDDPCQ